MNMSTIMQQYHKEVAREAARKMALAKREAMILKREESRMIREASVHTGGYPIYHRPSKGLSRLGEFQKLDALTKRESTKVIITLDGEKWFLGSFEELRRRNGNRYKNTWQCIRLVRMLCEQSNGAMTPDMIISGAHKC